MIDADVQFITLFDLTLTNKGVVVTDDINYSGLGENINNFRGVITVSGPQGTIYENTDFDNPDIIPGVSRESTIPIPLPLDPQTDYQTVLKGNYTVRYTVRNITVPEDFTNADTFSYQFDEPEIEATITSGPYSGILTSNDDTDYGSNISSLTREHRIEYPDELSPQPADVVSSNQNVQVTPIYTNEWTITITTEVEYTNPDTLQIKWSGSEEFTHCVYAGCIDGMYDAVETMRDSFETAILDNRVRAEEYERRLVLVNTAWHLLNVAYQNGDVSEADQQAAIIAEQIAYTGSGTCGGPTSVEVVPCPPYSGGGTPATYTFENGISESGGNVRLGGSPLIMNTSIVMGEYSFGMSGVDSGAGLTTSFNISGSTGVELKASNGSVESRVYAEPDKVTLELANLGTPADTRGYEITSNGLVEKADYTSGYGNRNLVSKSYVDGLVAGFTSYSFGNGLTESGGSVSIGGSFVQATEILSAAYTFDMRGADADTSSELHLDSNRVRLRSFSDNDLSFNDAVATVAAQSSMSYSEAYLEAWNGADVSFLAVGSTSMYIYDDIGSKGLVYFADYSTAGEADDLWLPSWGSVKNYVTGAAGSTTFLGLTDTPGAYPGAGRYLRVNSGNNALEFTTGDWVPSSGGTFTGQVIVHVGNNYPIVLRRIGAGGTPGTPESGINRVGFQDNDGDLQGYIGIGSGGNMELFTGIASATIQLLNSTSISGDLAVSGAFIPNAIQFNTSYTPGSPEPEGLVWWNDDDHTMNVSTGLGPIFQVGLESAVIVYNDTGSQIDNGSAIYPVGAFGGRPSVALANATTFEKVTGDVLIATMNIPDSSYGFATKEGKVRGLDTSSWSAGDHLWVSTVDGELTNSEPPFPAYSIQVGEVAVSDVSDGEIQVSIKGIPKNTIVNFWNGVFRESFDFTVSSNGTVITGSLEPTNGHDDMTMMFSDGLSILDTSPAAEIALTPGTDTIPQMNYVYVLQSTKTLTVSTSDWPTTEHIKVATVYLKSASATQTEGALRNQNWNDHVQSTTNGQGHLSHLGERIRQENAKWDSGAEGSMTIVGASTPDDVYVSVTQGVVYQMHRQTFPAQDMQIGDDIHVVNHPTTPFVTTTNLNTQIVDSGGSALNNRSFSFVVWGVSNKSGETSHIMLNLPSGSYAYPSPDDAVDDANNYSVYDIPKEFQGVGFLIARFTVTYFNNVWTLYSTEDLRGKSPNLTAGGGGGGGGVSTFLGLTDTPSAYASNAFKIPHINAGETALEFIQGPYKAADYTSCAANSTTNITIGSTTDLAFLLHYVANRDVGTIERRSGTIQVMYDSTTGTVTYSDSYLGSDIGLEIQADENAGNIRLNIIVDNVSANSLNFDYKIYSKFVA